MRLATERGRRGDHPMGDGSDESAAAGGGRMSALAVEIDGIDLGAVRLNRRARRVLQRLGDKPMLSIPAACGGWNETRAAYRLFDHPQVTAQAVLEPHIACTIERMGDPSAGAVQSRHQRDRLYRQALHAGAGATELGGPPGAVRASDAGDHARSVVSGAARWVPLDPRTRESRPGQGSEPSLGRAGERALSGRVPASQRTGRAAAGHPPHVRG